MKNPWKIANEIKRMIVERSWKKLPPERKLAKDLGVSRNTLREALRILEYEKIISRKQGKGTFVEKNKNLKIYINPSSIEVETHNVEFIFDVLEVRWGLEASAVRSIILHADISEKEWEKIERILEELEERYRKGIPSEEVDREFHKSIIKLSHNPILIDLYKTIWTLISIIWKYPLGVPHFGDKSIPYHRDLLEALKRKDLDGAIKAISDIVESDLKDILSFIQEKGV